MPALADNFIIYLWTYAVKFMKYPLLRLSSVRAWIIILNNLKINYYLFLNTERNFHTVEKIGQGNWLKHSKNTNTNLEFTRVIA